MSFFDKLAKRLELDDFDKRDKTAFVVLGCAAILILVLWYWQLQNNIIGPLYGGSTPEKLRQAALEQQASATAADENLKNKDTDKDGLSDWDELNVYKTSPYLTDSDSDGINDFEEIKKGTDPNCPTGQQCNQATQQEPTSAIENLDLINLLNETTTTTVSPDVTTTVTPKITSGAGQSNSGSPLTAEEKDALKKILGSSKDPVTLRNFLLASGSDKTFVDSLSDQELQKVIDEILK